MAEQNLIGGITGAISGLIIAGISVLGLSKRIDKKMDVSAFKEFKDANASEHKNMNSQLSKLFNKVDEIHKDMPKRNGD